MRGRWVLTVCGLAVSALLAGLVSPSNADAQTPRFAPRTGTVLSSPPLLRWRAVRHARFYNVQLYRGRQKVLSRWPTRSRLQLRWIWTYRHRHYRLRPAVYRWYVWPRVGSRYGRSLVRSNFIFGRPPANTSPPGISGSPREGITLTAFNGTWTGTLPMRFSYQWRRCDVPVTVCADIPGANAPTWQLGAQDIDHTVLVVVTASNLARAISAASVATPVVVPAPPVNVAPPTIWGGLQDGSTLIAANGSWTSSRAVSYAFSWQRCDRAGRSCGTIAGATGQAYSLTTADVEKRVQVLVTATNPGGAAAAASAPTSVVGRVFVGTAGNDVIRGTLGADIVRAGFGDDTVYGLAGHDRLFGGGGADRLFGGRGSDQIFTRDTRIDSVNCGVGVDQASANLADRVRACETVVRQ